MVDDPASLLRHLTEVWDDADNLAALDELTADLAPDPETLRTLEERAAYRAAREDWERDEPAA